MVRNDSMGKGRRARNNRVDGISTVERLQKGRLSEHAGTEIPSRAKAYRWIWGAAVAAIWLIILRAFLSAPAADGLLHASGEPITRGELLLTRCLVPDSIAALWFGSSDLPTAFLDRLPLLIASLVWWLIAWVIGEPIVQFASRSIRIHRAEHAALACLIGAAWLSTLTLVFGMAGLIGSRWPLLCAVLGLVGAVSWLRRGRRFADVWKPAQVPMLADDRESAADNSGSSLASDYSQLGDRSVDSPFVRWLDVLPKVATCVAALLIIAGSLLPANDFDVVEYHQQAPREFYKQGHIAFLPHNIYANMPLGSEMHTLAAMILIGGDPWWSALVGKQISADFTLITALLIGGYVARRFGRALAWPAAGLWLVSPGNALVADAGLIDSILAAYLTAAFVCTEFAIGRHTERAAGGHNTDTRWLNQETCWWFCAAVTAGAAAACKYTGLIYVVLPVAIISFVHLVRTRSKKWIGITVVCAAGLCVTCVPWYLKNAVQAGNPFYPLAANWFGGKTLSPKKIAQWQQAHRVPWASRTDQPWMERIQVELGSIGSALRSFLSSGSMLPPALFALFLFGAFFCLRRQVDLRRLVLWSLWVIVVWWCATHRIDRFWLPMLGLVVIGAAVGIWKLRSVTAPWISQVIVLTAMLYGLISHAAGDLADNRFFVSLQALRFDAGNFDGRVGRLSPLTVWINRELNRDASTRILMIGEAAVFQFDPPIVYSTCFDLQPAEEWLRGKRRRNNPKLCGRRGSRT
ncbi:MAG: hypothetical protein U0892_12935 [Pirellulales bacterium]